MLMDLIAAVSQHIYPKLKFCSRIPISGAIDYALTGTFMMSPPLNKTLKDEIRAGNKKY